MEFSESQNALIFYSSGNSHTNEQTVIKRLQVKPFNFFEELFLNMKLQISTACSVSSRDKKELCGHC